MDSLVYKSLIDMVTNHYAPMAKAWGMDIRSETLSRSFSEYRYVPSYVSRGESFIIGVYIQHEKTCPEFFVRSFLEANSFWYSNIIAEIIIPAGLEVLPTIEDLMKRSVCYNIYYSYFGGKMI